MAKVDPYEQADIKNLMSAVEAASKSLRVARENRMAALRQYVGKHYSDGGSSDKVPINMIELAATIYSQKLVAMAPRALVNTPHVSLRSESRDFETMLNASIEDLNLEETLQDWVYDAIFGLGIIKVGVCRAGVEEYENHLLEASEPYADTVLFEDFIFDTTAKSWKNVCFAGHRFRIPLEEAKAVEAWDEKAREKLSPTTKRGYDDNGDQRSQGLTDENNQLESDEYKSFVEIWEIWLPFEGLVVTIPCDYSSDTPPLEVKPWKGPKRGPYHLLGFNAVPGNILPLPPVAIMMDLHEIINRLFNKSVRQGERAKQVTAYAGEQLDDARRIRDAGDGEMIRLDNPQGLNQIQVGGVDNNNLAFQIHAKDQLDYLAGNLSALGGLGPQSDTLGQDRMLRESSSDRINKMQRKVMRKTQLVLRDLGWHLWNDPLIQPPMTRRVPNTQIEVPVDFSPDRRMGEYFDYNIDIEPYSMTMQSPSDRVQFLTQVFQQFIAPMMPQLQAQGIVVDHEAFLELLARYSNVPELLTIVKFTGQLPEMPQERGPVDGPYRPSSTTRTNVRVNRPGRTMQGQSQIMQQVLAGGNPQQSELASVGRPA